MATTWDGEGSVTLRAPRRSFIGVSEAEDPRKASAIEEILKKYKNVLDHNEENFDEQPDIASTIH